MDGPGQGLPGIAQRYYLLGLNACQEIHFSELSAKIIGDMALLSLTYGHYDDSLDLLHAARYILPRHDSRLVRTELLGRESRCHGLTGNQTATLRAADACLATYHDSEGEVPPTWLDYVDQANVDGLVANTFLELALHTENRGQVVSIYAERAERYVLSSRAGRLSDFERSRVLDEIRLAHVRLAQQELSESVSVAQAAIEHAAHTSSTLVCDELVNCMKS